MEFEFLTTSDKPALLALQTPQYVEAAKAALFTLGYKVHGALNHGAFISRFVRIPYQVVILEELFDARTLSLNLTLQNLQAMPMNQRRHAAIVLIGDTFQTLNPLQAFALSVNGVVHRADADKLSQVVQQVVSDNDLFLNAYRDTLLRAAQGKV